MRNDMALAPAWELAQGIQQRMITATDVVESVLQRINAYNSQVNAVIGVDIDDIRRQAREADAELIRDEASGSIHGLPITFKDTFETEGMRTTAGDPSLADYVPSQDATVVARLRQAGAIIIGKTNVPPMA